VKITVIASAPFTPTSDSELDNPFTSTYATLKGLLNKIVTGWTALAVFSDAVAIIQVG